MQRLLQHIRLTALCILLFGVVYPLVVVWPAEVLTPNLAAGKPLVQGNRTVGFTNVGQAFDSTIYFWGRPSAVGYNAAATGGSNKGPTNADYLAQVKARLEAFVGAHPYLQATDVPAEMVTASGGGLDPHVSPQGARIQAERVAAARKLDPARVQALVEQHVEGPLLGLFGPTRINVLQLNQALDALTVSR